MATLSAEVQDLFNSVQTVVFATADTEAQPNVNIIAIKIVIDDSTVYLSDQFFKKTLANIKQNQKVAIAFWNQDAAYQIHGTARYVTDGTDFDELKEWADGIFKKIGMPVVAKGGCFVHVDALYNSKSGEHAGELLA